MNICKRNGTIDIVEYRCHKRNPIYDIKKNLRNGTILEYYCFIKNTNINAANEKKSFVQQIWLISIKIITINKFFLI